MDKYTRNDFEENYQQPDTFQEPFVGRVDLSPNENGTPFFVQDKIHKNEKTNYSNAMQGLMENSLLSITFFSAKNIESIQNVFTFVQKYSILQTGNTRLTFKIMTN